MVSNSQLSLFAILQIAQCYFDGALLHSIPSRLLQLLTGMVGTMGSSKSRKVLLQAVARMRMLSGDGSRATSLQPPLAARPPPNIDARKFQIFMHPSQSARAAVHPASSWIGQTREPGRSRRAQERTPLPSQAKNSYFARRYLRPQCRYIASHLRGPPWTNCRRTPQTNCRLRLESTFGGGCENCERPPQRLALAKR